MSMEVLKTKCNNYTYGSISSGWLVTSANLDAMFDFVRFLTHCLQNKEIIMLGQTYFQDYTSIPLDEAEHLETETRMRTVFQGGQRTPSPPKHLRRRRNHESNNVESKVPGKYTQNQN